MTVEIAPPDDDLDPYPCRPRRFCAWAREYAVVEVVEMWREARTWWEMPDLGHRPDVEFWRVRASGTRIAEVLLRNDDGAWHVIGVED